MSRPMKPLSDSVLPSLLVTLLFANAGVASAGESGLPWNPYHGARPPAKPSGPHGGSLYDAVPPIQPPQELQMEREPLYAPFGEREPVAPPEIVRGRPGLYSGPQVPESWSDPNEYPEGPYGPRIVRAVVPGSVIRSHAIPAFEALKRELFYWEDTVRVLDDRVRDLHQRLSVIEPLRRASQRHLQAWLDLRDDVEFHRRDADAARARRDEIRGLLDAADHRVRNAGETVVVWRIPNPQGGTYVPRSHLERKAVRYVLDHPDRIGEEIHLRF